MTGARHYLDCNATMPLRPEARQAIADALLTTGNASSVHAEGRAARALIERAREAVARLAGVAPAAVHFTASGTEANNWALAAAPGRTVAVSAVEHDSVLRAAERRGARLLPVDFNGVVRLDALEAALVDGVGLVSLMAANNETGVLQPVAEAAALCRAHGAILHVDAVQAAGKLELAPLAAEAALLSLSAHKLGGPAGCGALIVGGDVAPPPLLVGGGQEARRRAGTENLLGIVGFGAAAAAAQPATEAARLGALQRRLEAALLESCPALEIFGADVSRLSNTTCVRMPGVAAEVQVMSLDLAGVAVSAGAACSSGKVRPSHVLAAMGREEEAGEAIRISTGWATSAADIDAAAEAWSTLWQRKSAA